MRGALLTLGLAMLAASACRPAPAPRVEISQPPPAAPPKPVEAPARVETDAVPLHAEAKGAWARAFPAEKDFHEVKIGEALAVTFVWHLGPQHKKKELPPEDDYPANYVQATELRVVGARGAAPASIPLGELSGFVERFDLTYCRGRGFRLPDGDAWGIASEPSIAASFSLGVPQGNSEFLLVRDADTLHVLHRETSDGRCDDIKQGPLDGCEGFEFARVADVHVPHAALLYERIDDDGKPLECVADHYGRSLLPP